MGLAKKKNEAYHNHKHSIGNSNARSMNNFLNTEPLTMSGNNKPLNDNHADLLQSKTVVSQSLYANTIKTQHKSTIAVTVECYY